MEVVTGICEIILENKKNIIHNELIQEMTESNKELKLIVANNLWDKLKVGFKGNLIVKYKMQNIYTSEEEYKLIKYKVKLKNIVNKLRNDFDAPEGTIYIFKKLIL